MFNGAANASVPYTTPVFDDIEFPEDEEPSRGEVELGKFLFFDKRLSANSNTSCATCHDPNNGFGDGLQLSLGTQANELERNTPHLYNLAWSSILFWDGRSNVLEHQVLMPISNPDEMDLSAKQLLDLVRRTPYYQRTFKSVYEESQIDTVQVSRALAAFVRSIRTVDSPFDQYLAGKKHALSPEAKRGMELFRGKADCTQCHDGPNFTDDSFHSLGIATTDKGRGNIINEPSMAYRFKTPGLRNVLLTGPYMHDGSLPNLEAVLDFYNRGGGTGPNKDNLMKPLGLSKSEIRDLIAFLASLTDPVIIHQPNMDEIYETSSQLKNKD